MRIAALAPAAILLLSAGCRGDRRAPPDVEAPKAAPTASAGARPVDRLLPGELAEGTDKAFGLVLPRAMRVRGKFDDVVTGDVEVTADRVSNYFRERVTAEKIAIGPLKTVFSRAIVRGQPGVELTIEVLMHDGTTEVIVRNLSLVKPRNDLMNDEERWRAAGFKPDGTLDPAQLK